MVSFGKRYFVLSFAHMAFQSCGQWKDTTFFLLGEIILESELRDVSGFFVVFGVCLFCFYVLSFFVRRQCWATCPTVLTMGVSRLL
jgi:hypothetical protein